jgi:glutaredoxin
MSKSESLHQAIQDNKIVIMTIPNCSYCIKAKDFLKKKKKVFKELLYTSELDEEFWKKYKKKYPFVPRIIIDQEFIGGFLELKDYKKEKPEKKDKAKDKEKPKKKKMEKMTNIGKPTKKKKVDKKKKVEESKLKE